MDAPKWRQGSFCDQHRPRIPRQSWRIACGSRCSPTVAVAQDPPYELRIASASARYPRGCRPKLGTSMLRLDKQLRLLRGSECICDDPAPTRGEWSTAQLFRTVAMLATQAGRRSAHRLNGNASTGLPAGCRRSQVSAADGRQGAGSGARRDRGRRESSKTVPLAQHVFSDHGTRRSLGRRPFRCRTVAIRMEQFGVPGEPLAGKWHQRRLW
jgi:hypothetical protein